MGSANKTTNYGLNQWQSNEYPNMDDFNADNAAIDAAMKANANAAAAAQAAIPAAGTDLPLMDGVAAAGSSAQYARGNHVHPTDTSRAAQADMTAAQAAISTNASAIAAAQTVISANTAAISAAQASIAAHQSALNDLAVWAAMGGM